MHKQHLYMSTFITNCKVKRAVLSDLVKTQNCALTIDKVLTVYAQMVTAAHSKGCKCNVHAN